MLFKFLVDETKCMNCGACMDLCPMTAIEFTRCHNTEFYGELYTPTQGIVEGDPKPWMMEKPYLPNQERCTGCQICARECPTNAITVETDSSQPSNARPVPVIVQAPHPLDDGYWHPLSEYTTEYLKRPIRSPWSNIAEWKPMGHKRGISQTWRTMEKKDS